MSPEWTEGCDLQLFSPTEHTHTNHSLPQKYPSMNSPPPNHDGATPPPATAEGSSRSGADQPPLSRYESQKRRDWNTFGQYLKNQRPPVSLSHCNCNHVLEFLRYLDQFGKTKVHLHGCVFFGQPDPPSPCTCPLRQAWGSLDALIGRLRAAYEENGGSPENNPFGNGAIRVYLREVKECQAKARGIPYKKKKKRKLNPVRGINDQNNTLKQSTTNMVK